jgi:hypothetical protein
MFTTDVGPRVFFYVLCTTLATVIAFSIGVDHFDSSCDENDPEVTECDLGAVYGFAAGFSSFLVCVAVVVVIEVVLAVRRHGERRRSLPGQPPDVR